MDDTAAETIVLYISVPTCACACERGCWAQKVKRKCNKNPVYRRRYTLKWNCLLYEHIKGKHRWILLSGRLKIARGKDEKDKFIVNKNCSYLCVCVVAKKLEWDFRVICRIAKGEQTLTHAHTHTHKQLSITIEWDLEN